MENKIKTTDIIQNIISGNIDWLISVSKKINMYLINRVFSNSYFSCRIANEIQKIKDITVISFVRLYHVKLKKIGFKKNYLFFMQTDKKNVDKKLVEKIMFAYEISRREAEEYAYIFEDEDKKNKLNLYVGEQE